MRLLPVLPFLGLALVSQAAVDAIPGVVATREGGMGLGSALVVGQVFAVAGLALGAVIGAYLVDRGSDLVAVVAGALLAYGASIAVGMQPMGSLIWVVVALAAGGVGLGLVLTAAFSAAARLPGRSRVLAVLLLLLAAVVGRGLIGLLHATGVTGLTVAAAVGVLAAVFIVRGRWTGRAEPATATTSAGARPLSAGVALVGGVLVGVGVLTALAGAEPSRVTAVVFADNLGLASLETLDTIRLALVLIGLVASAAGVALIALTSRGPASVGTAGAALALAAVAVAGTTSTVALGGEPGGVRSAGLHAAVSAAAAIGSIAGLGLGAWWLVRGASPGSVATAGCLLIALVTSLALFVAGGGGTPPAAAGALIGLLAAGGGLAAVALRAWLAAVTPSWRGRAAATGVIAAIVGGSLGSMVGTGEALASLGTSPGVRAGAVLVATAVAAAVLVAYPAVMRLRRGAGPSTGT